MELEKMPNLGKVVSNLLRKAEINTAEELIKVGSKEAFLRIRELDSTACINMLYALEGAVQGIRWYGLSEESKKDLKEFFNSIGA